MNPIKILLAGSTFLACSLVFAGPVAVSDLPPEQATQGSRALSLLDPAQEAQKTLFAPIKSQIPYAEALEALNLAEAAYEEDLEAVKVRFAGYAVAAFEAASGLYEGVFSRFGYVASKIDEAGQLIIKIMIRGTSSKNDALTDATLAFAVLDGRFTGGVDPVAKVHTGFQKSALSALESLSEILEDLRVQHGEAIYANAQVTLVGHSLGGAMATLVGMALAHNTYFAPKGVSRIVTFGAPAVGNKDLVKLLNGRVRHQTHFAQSLDLVGQLRAHHQYADFSGRQTLYSQNAFYEGALSTHGLAGYKKSLEVKYGKSAYQGGWTGAAMEMVAPLAVPMANHTINGVAEVISDPLRGASLWGQITGFLRSFWS